MAYNKAKLKSNGDKKSPSFQIIFNRKCIRQMFTYIDFTIGIVQTHFNKVNYREDFYFVDWFNGSVRHGEQCTAGCEAHMNFVNESACLMANNVQNEIVTICRS
jgi:hypothetical protein